MKIGNEVYLEQAKALITGFIEEIILWSRYLLVPLLMGLLIKILSITICFYEVIFGHTQLEELSQQVLVILELIDITMIANFIWLLAAGSYYVFVDNNYPGTSGRKRPRCLTHVSSGILKEKMAGSLIGVSSVALLQLFIGLEQAGAANNWIKMIVIHIIFIAGLLAFGKINEADHHNDYKEKEGH